MKLSQLIDLLQRYHDLYPDVDPEVIMTTVDYAPYDTGKNNPEYGTHTLDVKMLESRALVYLPEGKLYSEKGPYLNIFYELKYIDKVEDFWNKDHLQQHEQSQSGSTHSRSCQPAEAGAELGGEPVPTETQGSAGDE